MAVPAAQRIALSASHKRRTPHAPAPSARWSASSARRRFGPQEQEVGDVDAGHDQHQQDRDRQRRERPSRRADDDVVERPDDRHEAARPRRALLLEPPRQRVQLLRRLRARHTRAKPRDEVDFTARRGRELGRRRHRVRREHHVGAGRKVEAGRHHADDGEALVAERDAAADDVAGAGEPAAEQRMADDEHRLGAVDVVGGAQQAASGRLHSEDVEQRPGDERAVDGLGHVAVDEQRAAGGVGVHASNRREQAALGADPRDLGVAERIVLESRRRQRLPGDDEGPRLAYGQRPQQHPAHEREHHRRAGDADGEDEDARGAEGPRPPEGSRRQPQIPPHPLT